MTLGKEWDKSTQGLIKTAPAGNGKLLSLKTVRRDKTIPPPAESPARTIVDGSCRVIKYKYDARTSKRAIKF